MLFPLAYSVFISWFFFDDFIESGLHISYIRQSYAVVYDSLMYFFFLCGYLLPIASWPNRNT